MSVAKNRARSTSRRRAPVAARKRSAAKGTGAPAQRTATRLALAGGVAVALSAAFHVWTGLWVSQLGYERSQAIALGQRLEVQRQELADELAGLMRTEVLEEQAARRLGLGPPTAGQVVDLRATQVAIAPRGGRP